MEKAGDQFQTAILDNIETAIQGTSLDVIEGMNLPDEDKNELRERAGNSQHLPALMAGPMVGDLVEMVFRRLFFDRDEEALPPSTAQEQGETPLEIPVNANKSIELLMVAEGYNDFTEELILKPGEKVSINKKLVRKRGNIRITSEPSGATIYIDGKLELDAQEKTLKTPADLYMLFGEHELELKK